MSERFVLLFKNLEMPKIENDEQGQLLASFEKLGYTRFCEKYPGGFDKICDFINQRNYFINNHGKNARKCPECDGLNTYFAVDKNRPGERRLHCRTCALDFDVLTLDYSLYVEYENSDDNLMLDEWLALRTNGELLVSKAEPIPVCAPVALPVMTPCKVEPIPKSFTKEDIQRMYVPELDESIF